MMTDLQSFLNQLKRNLQTLKERQAQYGLNAPLKLINQIEGHEQAITLTEQAIAEDMIETE